jgi:hypothetical protein
MLTFNCHELDAALAGWGHWDHAVALTVHGNRSMTGVVHLGVTRPGTVMPLRAVHIVLTGGH